MKKIAIVSKDKFVKIRSVSSLLFAVIKYVRLPKIVRHVSKIALVKRGRSAKRGLANAQKFVKAIAIAKKKKFVKKSVAFSKRHAKQTVIATKVMCARLGFAELPKRNARKKRIAKKARFVRTRNA